MTAAQIAAGVAGGALLAALPFLHYVSIAGSPPAHADHEPRYGGQLGMVGDHHIELRRQNGLVEAFISDAERRPRAARAGWVVFDGAVRVPLTWNGHHLSGPDVTPARTTEAIVILDDGSPLTLSFDWSDPAPRP